MLQTIRLPTTGGAAALAAMRPSPLPGLDGRAPSRSYRAGELICGQGEEAEHVFQVQRGALKVYKVTPDGRRQIIGFLGEGDFLGLACQGEYPCSAEALTEAAVTRVAWASLDRLAQANPALGCALLNFARKEIASAHEQMLLLGRMSPLEKLASFLLRLSEAAEERGEDPARLSLAMSRLDIADYLGLTIETVSRCFTKLRKARIIDLPHATDVVMRDLERLAELAAADQDIPCPAA